MKEQKCLTEIEDLLKTFLGNMYTLEFRFGNINLSKVVWQNSKTVCCIFHSQRLSVKLSQQNFVTRCSMHVKVWSVDLPREKISEFPADVEQSHSYPVWLCWNQSWNERKKCETFGMFIAANKKREKCLSLLRVNIFCMYFNMISSWEIHIRNIPSLTKNYKTPPPRPLVNVAWLFQFSTLTCKLPTHYHVQSLPHVFHNIPYIIHYMYIVALILSI